MNAVILSGGFGSRLMPFTDEMPKPLLGIANAPMLDYSLSQLTHYGIRDIVFTLAFFPSKIIEWTMGYVNISSHYNIEDKPMGTCGGIKSASKYLDDQFFVLSGDGISNVDLSKMSEAHRLSGAEITMAITPVENPSLYGVVQTDKDGFVNSFIEKPKYYTERAYVNCGIYLINKRILERVPDAFYDFSKDLFPDMLNNKIPIGSYVHNGYWNDVGSLESYYRTNFDIKQTGAFFPKEKNIYRNTTIKSNSKNSLLSKNSKIYGDIKNCIIGNNCTIKKDAQLENCIILNDSAVAGKMSNCIISNNHFCKIADFSSKIANSQNSTKKLDSFFYNR